MDKIGNYILPLTVIIILTVGFVNKVPVFDTFVSGAKEGIQASFSILPTLVGLMMAVSMLQSSGALDLLSQTVSPLTKMLGFPSQVLPLALLRPFSGSGSTALAASMFEQFKPDSFIGRVVSVMMGSTETTFYAIAVYYGAVGIKKTRHTVPAAIAGDIASMAASVFAVQLLFS